jgi:hypothetical protein
VHSVWRRSHVDLHIHADMCAAVGLAGGGWWIRELTRLSGYHQGVGDCCGLLGDLVGKRELSMWA